MARILELIFPFAGVSRLRMNTLTGDGGQYSTPFAVNMRPEDPLSHRRRGGSRPGLTAFTGTVPSLPTGRLETEAGAPIWTEAGAEILLPIAGSPVLYPGIMQALGAYGFAVLTDDIEATVGVAPTDPDLGCVWRDRLVLAKSGVVYLSRQGDWADWDYGGDVEDAQRAFVLQPSEATELAADITALIPHRDSTLVMSTQYGLWVLKGDPAHGGTLSNISRNVGVVADKAWCKAGDTIFFLAVDGLYGMTADGRELKNLSKDRLPVELEEVDTDSVDVMLGYNHDDSGIYVFLEGGDYHWYYDLQSGGFWPFTLGETVEALFTADGKMVIEDGDGDYWTVGGDDDDGTDIQSHLLIGPLRAGKGIDYGMIAAMHGAVQTSGSVTWSIIVGDTAEGVAEDAKDAVESYLANDFDSADAYVFASGTWSGGRSYMAYPRSRGVWQVLWLRSDDPWAYEGVVAEIQKFGRWR